MGLGKLFSGLKRTRDRLASGLSRLLGIKRKLDREFLEELEEVLYTSDLGKVGTDIVSELGAAYEKREIKDSDEVPAFGSTAARARSRARPRGRP
jgi:fused signal recognition particle receptor